VGLSLPSASSRAALVATIAMHCQHAVLDHPRLLGVNNRTGKTLKSLSSMCLKLSVVVPPSGAMLPWCCRKRR
jgi:hypothetical protein